MRQRHFILVLFSLASFLVVVLQCTQVKKKDSRGPAYAGSSTCKSCHEDVSTAIVHNAHFNTSRFIAGTEATDSLGLPQASFVFTEKTKLGVEKRSGDLFQVAYIDGREVKAEKTDFAFGAGLSAYTFAYWYGNQLFQMPLNYHTREQQWVNSPGFPEEQIYFGRPIITRCLECHSSYVKNTLVQTNDLNLKEEFVKGSLIAGIDCERCHGPAMKHVEFHREHPQVKEATHMAVYRSLPLSRRIDMCAVCHSGISLQVLTSTFSFKPGDTLKSLPQYSTYAGQEPDVHGNQKQLLEASPCFKIGKAECVSCHDIHEAKKQSLEVYTQKCRSCHQNTVQDHQDQNQALLKQQCIDCHMPMLASTKIGFQVSNSKKKIPYQVRTHRIAVYEDVIKDSPPKIK
ncbi:multiheme c-type cytochrome [Pedobacter sp.]|uniref:multiheme c-type cytochrome n=1 Tax=Pedobacter sp. TaxID=1411316 RepID=UPI003D7FAEA1